MIQSLCFRQTRGCNPVSNGQTRETASNRPSSAESLPEYRLTDRRAKGAQPAWKLFYPGAVGSQALLGIPYVAKLRADPRSWLQSINQDLSFLRTPAGPILHLLKCSV
jgi:hypothetical protein